MVLLVFTAELFGCRPVLHQQYVHDDSSRWLGTLWSYDCTEYLNINTHNNAIHPSRWLHVSDPRLDGKAAPGSTASAGQHDAVVSQSRNLILMSTRSSSRALTSWAWQATAVVHAAADSCAAVPGCASAGCSLQLPSPDVIHEYGKGVHNYLGIPSWPIIASNRDPTLTEYISTKPSNNTAAYMTTYTGGLYVSCKHVHFA